MAAGEDDRNESWERMKYQRGTVVSPTADLETDDMRQKLADLLVTKPTLLLVVQFVFLFWPLAFYFRASTVYFLFANFIVCPTEILPHLKQHSHT